MNKVELNTLTQVNNNERNFLSALNENLKRIQAAINDTLSRSGVLPNQMEEVLDMNGKRIVNVGPAVNPTDVVTRQDIQNIIDAANEAIAQLDRLVEDGKIALMTYASEYIYPTCTAAVDACQLAQRKSEDAQGAAEAARDALLLNADYQAIVANLTTILALVNDIENLDAIAADLTNIDTVAGISSDVSAVAGISSAVTTLAGISATLTALNNNLTAINGVYDDLSKIESVYTALPEVEAVYAALSDIGAVADALTTISSVAAALTTLANIEDNLTTLLAVGADLTNLDSLAADLTNLDSIANNLTEILQASTYASQAASSASNAQIWAEGTDQQVVPLGGQHSAKVWAQYIEEIIAGTRIYGGTFDSTTATATLTSSAKAKLGVTSDSIVLTNDNTAVTGYGSNEGIEYYVAVEGTFASLTLHEGDILWSTGSAWKKIDNSVTVIPDATESVKGIAALATTAEAEAGANDTKIMTPLKTKQAIAEFSPELTDIALAGTNVTFTDPVTINYTKVGNPTVSADYVVSGFSSSKYLTTQLPSITTSFEFYSKVYVPATTTSTSGWPWTFSISGTNSGWGIRENWENDGKFKSVFSINERETVYSEQTFADTWVWIAVIVDANEANLYCLADATGETYTVDTLPSVSDNVWTKCAGYTSNRLSYLSGKTMYIGLNYQGGAYTAGSWSIDMLNTKYIADSSTIWYGVSIATKTTINATIPASYLQNTATGSNSLTIGGTSTSRTNSVNIGIGSSQTNANAGVIIGYNASGSVAGATAVGAVATVSGYSGIAIGSHASTSGSGSVTIGNGAKNTEAKTFKVALNSTAIDATDEASGLFTLLNSSGKVPTGRYIAMTGADGTNAGTIGAVPAPAATDNTKFLRGDGAWAEAGGGAASYDALTETITL